MRIGVDARLLAERLTGIGRYTAEMIRELSKKSGEFYLYSAATFPTEQWQKDNVTIRSANYRSRGSRMLWSQTSLPYWAGRDQLDVFWGPTHRIPRFLSQDVARVVTIHDMVWKYAGETMRQSSRFIEKRLMPQAIRLADRIVADSISTAKDIEAEYPAVSDQIRVVYPGATNLPAPLSFQSLSVLGIHSPYFLFVGTLEPRKNLIRLLEAYSLLDLNIKNRARLVIAGGKGWGGMDFTGMVKDLGMDDHVILTGYVNDTQLATLYAHARFLAMPSIHEGFGLPVIEAMSCGVPVLTSNRSSLPEIAGNASLLVDPFDVASITTGLSTLMLNDTLRNSLASKAVSNAKCYTWANAANQMWAVFEEAAAARAELRKCLLRRKKI